MLTRRALMAAPWSAPVPGDYALMTARAAERDAELIFAASSWARRTTARLAALVGAEPIVGQGAVRIGRLAHENGLCTEVEARRMVDLVIERRLSVIRIETARRLTMAPAESSRCGTKQV